MIDYLKLKNSLNSSEDFSDFKDIVEMAISQQMKAYLPRIFPSENDAIKSREKAEHDILLMKREQISELCQAYEIGIDFQIKQSKEQKVDWEHQETKRISSTSTTGVI
tara:strand:+ start:796 stop:1119 length:324 start_codon:yes stop_codon:yes gene_type:complete